MSENKVATATKADADWSFYEDESAMAAIQRAAREVHSMFRDRLCIDFEDVLHDALLHVAVRPEMVARHEGSPVFLYRDVRRAMMEKADRETRGDFSLDVLLEGELV